MQDIILSIRDIRKSFGGTPVLKGVSADIIKGEFITLLGPSGCGKTTALRTVAGLERLDFGEIILNGKNVENDPPNKRSVNTVFQNYALFPHMNVYDNIAYGPRIAKADKTKLKKRISDMLDLVKMGGYEKRMPDKLSGGQRQRIAIARALINNPDILLLDEPLGALDLKLRKHMQTELKQMQRETGTTFIYVTHDQEEALNMSDRLAVMNDGMLEQTGTPKEVYDSPKTSFVADFVGDRNRIKAKLLKTGEKSVVEIAGERLLGKAMGHFKEGEEVFVYIHTDRVILAAEKFENSIPAEVKSADYTGSQTVTAAVLNDKTEFKIIQYNIQNPFMPGERIFAGFLPEHAVILGAPDADFGEAPFG